MNGDHLENELRRLGASWPSDSSLVDDVMKRIGVDSQPSREPWKRSLFMRANLSVAACILIGLGLWWAPSPSSGSRLYAAMKEALEKVDSFRVVTSVADDEGNLQPVAETWFQRQVGFAVHQPGVTRIDNGESFWEYRKGADVAVRRRSQDTEALVDEAIGVRDELEQDCKRFEAGDKTLNGIDLLCYQLTFHGSRKPADEELLDFNKRRTYVYVDDRSLLRRMESQERVDDKWRLKLVRNWEYDVDIDPQVFAPDFGEQIAIIDGDEVFTKLTNPTQSILTDERNGLIYAIHQAQRFENGGVLVMSSVRGSEETLAKYPPQQRMLQPGLYVTEGPAANYQASPQGNGYFRLSLATARQNGVHVEWWMMTPRGRKPDWFENDEGQVELQLGVTPQGEYAQAEHADADGVIQHITWTETLDLPEPETLPTLADLVEKVYQQAQLLQPVAITVLDLGIEDVDGKPQTRLASPEAVSAQQFVEAVYDHWRWWEQNDVEFQLTTGVKTIRIPGVDHDYPIPPSIGLSYCSVVDDRTLKRAAQNPELEVLLVGGTRITDDGLAALAELEHLRKLDISDTKISDAGLQRLENIESLERLTANRTNVTQEGVTHLKEAIPDLEIEFSRRDESH